MRLLMINLLAAALVLFSASFASAYELRLVSASDGQVNQGDIVSYDIFLDTQGVNEGIVLFSISLTYDPNVVTYRTDLSDAEDYYPLYAPAGTGKGAAPATYLVPVFDPPGTWPAPPAGLSQINVDFLESNLNPTSATATNQYLGTLAFEATGPLGSASQMNWSFDNGGNIFNVQGVGVEDSVSTPNTTQVIAIVPEPTTALLVGLGMVGLGVAGRRRA